jgi:uncharacterized lipoprotein YehR (DUF1307 family)
MKKFKRFITAALAVATLVVTLTGCGSVSFDVSKSDFETYAKNNSGTLTDVTSNHSDVSNVENVSLLTIGSASVELWDFSSTEAASQWIDDTQKTLSNGAKSYSGSAGSNGGSYTITTSDKYYRILFSGDKGIYAYGDKDAVNSALSALNIAK